MFAYALVMGILVMFGVSIIGLTGLTIADHIMAWRKSNKVTKASTARNSSQQSHGHQPAAV